MSHVVGPCLAKRTITAPPSRLRPDSSHAFHTPLRDGKERQRSASTWTQLSTYSKPGANSMCCLHHRNVHGVHYILCLQQLAGSLASPQCAWRSLYSLPTTARWINHICRSSSPRVLNKVLWFWTLRRSLLCLVSRSWHRWFGRPHAGHLPAVRLELLLSLFSL
jgi:hypothetical protein